MLLAGVSNASGFSGLARSAVSEQHGLASLVPLHGAFDRHLYRVENDPRTHSRLGGGFDERLDFSYNRVPDRRHGVELGTQLLDLPAFLLG
jgi:hypothetical protein